MKEEFFGFYDPTEGEVNRIWSEGTFVFDANTLLNLYRYSESTRTDFSVSLAALKERLFMPYQVGFEYHNNRHLVIEMLGKSYTSLFDGIKEVVEKTIKSHLNQYLRHPSISVEKLLELGEAY